MATPAQRSQWRRLSLNEMLEGPPDGSELQHHAPNTNNPQFPYVGGPGGEDASPTVLQILWNMMMWVQMMSYRPDFAQSVKSKDNMFLWNFATASFIQLAKCGEYKGLTANDTNPSSILERVICYAQNTLSRK